MRFIAARLHQVHVPVSLKDGYARVMDLLWRMAYVFEGAGRSAGPGQGDMRREATEGYYL